MDNFIKYVFTIFSCVLSYFAPVKILIISALVFVGFDFITGVVASYKRCEREQRSWAFESEKAWNTITKMVFVSFGIVLSWLIDSYILDFTKLNLANLFTGFVCSIEFWSYLENASEISNHPIFLMLKKYMKTQIDKNLEK